MGRTYSLYRGYVECGGKDGKEPMAPYKHVPDDKLDTITQAKKYAGYAGVLNHETVMLDADTAEQAALLKTIFHQADLTAHIIETNRGIHAALHDRDHIVEHCCQGVELACGIVVDVKTGYNNHASVDVLKVSGNERVVIADAAQDEDYGVLPAWCKVLRKLPAGQTASKLFGLKDGEGRDNALYGRAKDLVRLGLSTTDIKKALTVINKCVFAEPLDDATMTKFFAKLDDGTYAEEVKRDDDSKAADLYVRDKDGKKKGIDYDKAARYLIEKMGACRMYGNILWIASEDNIYRANEEAILLQIYKALPNIKFQDVQEIVRRIDLWAPRVEPADPSLIAFKNGALDMRTMQLSPITREMHLTNLINHEYHADAYSELMDRTMTKLTKGDDDMRMMIQQAIGFCMYRSNLSKKAYAFYGTGDSGKSTLLAVIEKMLGEENVCSVALDDMQSQFGLERLAGKTADIADELPDSFSKSKATNFFKNMTAGGKLAVDRKHRSTLEFYPYCGTIFATNSMPHVSDKSGVAYDRFAIVVFENKFSKKDVDYDPFISQKLSTEPVYEYLIRLGVEGLKKYLSEGCIVESERSKRASQEYAIECDPWLEWFEDFLMNSCAKTTDERIQELIWRKAPDEIYRVYSDDMAKSRSKFPLGKNSFSKKIMDRCGMTTRVMYNPHTKRNIRVYEYSGNVS